MTVPVRKDLLESGTTRPRVASGGLADVPVSLHTLWTGGGDGGAVCHLSPCIGLKLPLPTGSLLWCWARQRL